MRFRTFGIVVVALLLFAGTPASAMQTDADWVKFNSPEGRFSVSLPHQPEFEKDDSPAFKGVGNGRYVNMEEGYGFVCEYYDVDIPAGYDAQKSLDQTRDGIIAGSNSTKLSEKQLTSDGYPGRELEISFKGDNAIEMAATIRLFLVGNRLYSLSYVRKKDEKVSDGIAVKIFASFKLITK